MSSVITVGEETVLSETEQALRLFSASVEQIPGVLRADRYCIRELNEEGVRVVVADAFSAITHEVLRAKERVYAAFPRIRFSTDIRDAGTLGHDPE